MYTTIMVRVDGSAIGTHGRRGLRRLALGSDAEDVVRTSSIPLLLVRNKAGAPKLMRGESDQPRKVVTLGSLSKKVMADP